MYKYFGHIGCSYYFQNFPRVLGWVAAIIFKMIRKF
jgi:hypothetical protein